MFCIHCGKEIGDSSVYCSKCGRKQDAVGQKVHTKKSEKSTKRIIAIIAAAVAAVFVMLAGMIFIDYVVNLVLYSNPKTPEEDYYFDWQPIEDDAYNKYNGIDIDDSDNGNNGNNGNSGNDSDDDDNGGSYDVPDAGDKYNTKTPCTICNKGKCRKCGGSGYVYSSASGKNDRNCPGAYCSNGSCRNCGGDGWRD